MCFPTEWCTAIANSSTAAFSSGDVQTIEKVMTELADIMHEVLRNRSRNLVSRVGLRNGGGGALRPQPEHQQLAHA